MMRTIEVTVKSMQDNHRFRMQLVDSLEIINKSEPDKPPLKISLRYRRFMFLKWIVGIDIVINPYKFDKEE
jgi:hypothetical protein